jgi:hypothetical protein
MGCYGRGMWLKVKCKVFPVKEGGTGTFFHAFLTLALDEGEQLTTCHRHFITRKDSRYVPNMRVRVPQTWCRHFGEEKDLLLLLEFEPRLYRLFFFLHSCDRASW